jgi:hypothetical protein
MGISSAHCRRSVLGSHTRRFSCGICAGVGQHGELHVTGERDAHKLAHSSAETVVGQVQKHASLSPSLASSRGAPLKGVNVNGPLKRYCILSNRRHAYATRCLPATEVHR